MSSFLQTNAAPLLEHLAPPWLCVDAEGALPSGLEVRHPRRTTINAVEDEAQRKRTLQVKDKKREHTVFDMNSSNVIFGDEKPLDPIHLRRKRSCCKDMLVRPFSMHAVILILALRRYMHVLVSSIVPRAHIIESGTKGFAWTFSLVPLHMQRIVRLKIVQNTSRKRIALRHPTTAGRRILGLSRWFSIL